MLFAVVVEVWRSGSVQCVSSNFFCDGVLQGVRYAYSFLLRKKWLKKATLPSGAVTVQIWSCRQLPAPGYRVGVV